MIELFFILFGIATGSFANNVISYYRTGEFDLYRSRCPECKTILKWYELIPLVSFLIVKGRCSYCEKTISVRYLIVEIAVTAIAVFSIMNWSMLTEVFIYFFFLTTLFILSLVDYYTLRLPNILMLLLLGESVFIIYLENDFSFLSVAGSLVLIFIFYLINSFYEKHKNRTAIGAGDIKLIGVLSLVTGFPLALISIWSAAFVSLLTIILFGSLKIQDKNRKIAFGPALAFSYSVIIINSENIRFLLNEILTGNM